MSCLLTPRLKFDHSRIHTWIYTLDHIEEIISNSFVSLIFARGCTALGEPRPPPYGSFRKYFFLAFGKTPWTRGRPVAWPLQAIALAV
jgi:hypothetical protein